MTSTTVVHCKREPYDVYIGRPSKWGNPYPIDKTAPDQDAERARVIALFREHILADPALLAALSELKGKTLGCYCKPKACHGDVLVELVDRIEATPAAATNERSTNA